ncbi:MAG: A/G-specific adenine glycosylase [Candidatus Heimdallarchaeota archaeon]
MVQKSLSEEFKAQFQANLLNWYRLQGRDLEWRKDVTPYRILVSEVLLHQTQVKTVEPIYRRFLKKFLNLEILAKADLKDVKVITDPLGYKVRGKWLHNIAKTVMETHNGKLPDTLEELMALDGIGRYTAGAILSFAFRKRAPIVDTNVERIIRRVFGLEDAPQKAATEKIIWKYAEGLLPSEANPQDIFDFNQGIMDLGALICETQPKCPLCPLRLLCNRGKSFPRQKTLEEFAK